MIDRHPGPRRRSVHVTTLASWSDESRVVYEGCQAALALKRGGAFFAPASCPDHRSPPVTSERDSLLMTFPSIGVHLNQRE